MRLELCVTHFRQQPSDRSVAQIFDQRGGTIGRATGNSWVLPDPERYVSSQHAAIEYRDGSFYILDTSANGLFINDPERKLGQGNSVALSHGDCLFIGDYEIQVTLLDDPVGQVLDFGADSELKRPPATDFDRDAAAGGHFPDEASPGPGASELIRAIGEEPFDPTVASVSGDQTAPDTDRSLAGSHNAGGGHVPFTEEHYAPPGAIPENWIDRSIRSDRTRPDRIDPDQIPEKWEDGAEEQAPSPPPVIPETTPERAPPRRSREPAEAALPQPQPKKAAPPKVAPAPPERAAPPGDAEFRAVDRAALETILTGAGLRNIDVPDAAVPVVLRLIGQLLQEAVKGTMDSLKARASIRQEMRMNLTVIRRAENNPLKFSPTVEEALTHLLAPRSQGYLPPRQAMREAFDDLNIHQVATMAGMEAALKHVLNRFDPDTLQARIREKAGLESLLPMNRKAKTWELFTKLYGDIARDAELDFNAVFGKAFTQAYEQHVQRLQAAKRK